MENFDKLLVVAGVMLIMWFTLLFFFWKNAEAVTTDPCNICAKRLGESVNCFAGNQFLGTSERIYYPNGSVNTLLTDRKIVKGELP